MQLICTREVPGVGVVLSCSQYLSYYLHMYLLVTDPDAQGGNKYLLLINHPSTSRYSHQLSIVNCQLKIWEILTGLIVYQTRIEALCDYLPYLLPLC